MKHAVGLGLQDFERVIEEKICYVDKTRFISEWWNGNDEVTLITRPRRLGKTLMMRQLKTSFLIAERPYGERNIYCRSVIESADC